MVLLSNNPLHLLMMTSRSSGLYLLSSGNITGSFWLLLSLMDRGRTATSTWQVVHCYARACCMAFIVSMDASLRHAMQYDDCPMSTIPVGVPLCIKMHFLPWCLILAYSTGRDIARVNWDPYTRNALLVFVKQKTSKVFTN